MKINFNNYSLVIIGNSHNPTVISDNFFLKTGIISNESEIDRNKMLITPALCQAFLKGNTNFLVEPNLLTVNSTEFVNPYEIGKKYCSNLGFIKSIAIGINFDISIEEYDFDKWFLPLRITDFNNCTTRSIVFTFDANPQTKANVTVTKNAPDKALLRFNFHKDTPNVLLGDLNIDFISEAKIFQSQSNDFIKSLLK